MRQRSLLVMQAMPKRSVDVRNGVRAFHSRNGLMRIRNTNGFHTYETLSLKNLN